MPELQGDPTGYVVQFGEGVVLWEDKGDKKNFGPMTLEDATAFQIAMGHSLCKLLYCSTLIRDAREF